MDIRTLGELEAQARVSLEVAKRNVARLCCRPTTVDEIEAAFDVCKSCFEDWLTAAAALKQAVSQPRPAFQQSGHRIVSLSAYEAAPEPSGWFGASAPPPYGQIVKVECEDGTFSKAVYVHLRHDDDPSYPFRDAWLSQGRQLPREIDVIRWRLIGGC